MKSICYFYLSWSNDDVEIPFVEERIASLNSIELKDYIKKKGIDFSFKYKELTDWDQCDDYLSNNLAIPLMSLKMKEIINYFLVDDSNNFKWHDVNVCLADGNQRKYFILEFEKRLNVLDKNKTIYESFLQRLIDGEVRRPAFNYRKIISHHLFHQPNSISWKFPSALYVSEDLKNKLTIANISGVIFSKALVVY